MTDDYREQVAAALPELSDIAADDLGERVVDAWALGLERGGWRHVEDVPYAWNIHEVSNAEHTRGVAKVAAAAVEVQRAVHDAEVDRDVVLAAALLHDVGKCYEYVDYVDAAVVDPDWTYAGSDVPHSLSGYALAHEVGCPLAVQRAIPHFVGEVPDRTVEAEVVAAANSVSSNAITQATMGLTLDEWVEEYSQATD